MSEEKIKDIPEFHHGLDDHILSKLEPSERYLAIELAKVRKEVRWGSELAVRAYNLGVDNQDTITTWKSSPLKAIGWVVATIMAAILIAFVNHFFEIKK